MQGVLDIAPTMASPLEALESTSSSVTKTTSNVDHEQADTEAGKPNSKILAAFSSDCSALALENIAQEFECRDEQPTNEPGIIDLEDRNNHNDGIETVLNILDKNISSANRISNSKSHTFKLRHMNKNDVAIIPYWTVGGAIDEFLRVHNCEPLLESDDDSENESCYSRGAESHASGISRKVNANGKSPHVNESQNQGSGREGYQDIVKQQADAQELKIKSLQAELDASRSLIASLEDQVNSHIPSPKQITRIVNQKREVEQLAVEKRMLEAQLASTQQQLADAKQNVVDIAAENKRLKDHNVVCESNHIDTQEQVQSDLNSTSSDTCQNDPPAYYGKDQDLDSWNVQQLCLDLNEAHNIIKRLENERARERKHYHRLMDGATNSRADLDSRIKMEMDNNLELRRKCYVYEQKMNAKKKMVIDLEYDRNRLADENQSLLQQVNHLKKLLGDENNISVEIECLQDINESLNEELRASMDENKRLREQLRRFKKVSSHKDQTRKIAASIAQSDAKQNEPSNTIAVATGGVNSDVFAKALKYLNEVEGGQNLSTSVAHKTEIECDNQPTLVATQVSTTTAEDEQIMLQESRKRFESLRLDFYGK